MWITTWVLWTDWGSSRIRPYTAIIIKLFPSFHPYPLFLPSFPPSAKPNIMQQLYSLLFFFSSYFPSSFPPSCFNEKKRSIHPFHPTSNKTSSLHEAQILFSHYHHYPYYHFLLYSCWITHNHTKQSHFIHTFLHWKTYKGERGEEETQTQRSSSPSLAWVDLIWWWSWRCWRWLVWVC